MARQWSGDDLAERFPPATLREYALVADGERGAILGPRGELAWLCVPRWDSPAVFASLIGGGGAYAVTPSGRFVSGGYYEGGTLIRRSRWVTTSSVIECREALAFPGEATRLVLLRRILAVEHDASLDILLEPRADYGRAPVEDLHHARGIWTGRTGPLRFRWRAETRVRAVRDATGGRGRLTAHLELAEGGHLDLVLEIGTELPDEIPEPDPTWTATEAAWSSAVPGFDETLTPGDARHSYAVLRGLTGSSGGMVAAATTSLPERAEMGRNYDYRYVWIRDQAYAGQAVAADGPHDLLDDAVRFVTERLLEHGPKLAPAYRVDGGRIPGQERLELAGYPGGFDLVGNWVTDQFQLDAFGEALLLLAAAAGHGRLETEGWRAVQVAVDAVEARWREPDAGIWEIDNRPWTHSRLTCVAGLRAAARAVAGQGPGTAAGYGELADAIMADTAARCVHPSGRWRRSPEDPGLDAALLLPPVRGALGADDPRTVTTLESYLAELTDEGYAYRFRHGRRPLGDAEGSFSLCGFVTALALDQQGRTTEGLRWFERLNATRGTGDLFTEEYDVGERQLRGNLPQAFVHALFLECAARLAGGRTPRD